MKPYTAAYMRVSSPKKSKRQTTASQREALQRYVREHRIKNVRWLDDHATGRKFTRRNLTTIIDDCRSGKCGRIIMYKLDRFGRNTPETLKIIRELVDAGITIVCVSQGLAFDNTAMGKFTLTIMAAVAELESDHISERVKAGLDVARKRGKILGKKPDNRKRYRLKRLLINHSLKESAAIMGVSYQAAWRMKQRSAA